jgi:hypothetical protein
LWQIEKSRLPADLEASLLLTLVDDALGVLAVAFVVIAGAALVAAGWIYFR